MRLPHARHQARRPAPSRRLLRQVRLLRRAPAGAGAPGHGRLDRAPPAHAVARVGRADPGRVRRRLQQAGRRRHGVRAPRHALLAAVRRLLHRQRDAQPPVDQRRLEGAAAVRLRPGLPELHRSTAVDLAGGLLRVQSRSPARDQAAGRPRLHVPLPPGDRAGLMELDQLLISTMLVVLVLAAGHTPNWVIPLVVLMAGVTYPLSFGGFTSFIPVLVPDDLLPPANALETTSFNSALVLGPALAGGLSGAFGPETSLLVEAGLALVALVLILRIPGLDRGPDRRGGDRTLLGVAIDGIRQIVSVPELRG